MKIIICSFIIIITFSFGINAQTAKIIAGTGAMGYNGAGLPALSTQFYNPTGITFNKNSMVYIADAGNSIIRKIDSAGNVVTVAGVQVGGGNYNGDGMPATAADLNSPIAIAFDTAGNLYIADTYNSRVRKVNTAGIITTVAGTGLNTYNGDRIPATTANIYNPSGIAFDATGNMYITEQSNHRVRKIDTKGYITTIVGNDSTSGYKGDNGIDTDAEMVCPYGITIDKKGNIYVTDATNSTLRKINTAGIITTVAGTGIPGYNGDGIAATNAQLCVPEGVAVDDSGNIYIADGANNRVREVNTKGIISTLVGANGKIIANFGFTSAINRNACGSIYFLDASFGDLWDVADSLVSVFPQSPIVCSGQGISLKVNGSGTYTWSPSAGLSATTGDSVLATPTTTTTYIVTSVSGCPANDTDIITVRPAPNVPAITVSVTGDSLISSADSYNQWYFNDQFIDSTRQVLVIKGHAKGWYTVTVTNPANGCSATSDSTTSIEQLSVTGEQLSIYPNPNNGNFNVQLSNKISNVQLELFNVLGQTIYSSKLANTHSEINLSARAAGIYLYRIFNEQGNTLGTGKLVIE